MQVPRGAQVPVHAQLVVVGRRRTGHASVTQHGQRPRTACRTLLSLQQPRCQPGSIVRLSRQATHLSTSQRSENSFRRLSNLDATTTVRWNCGSTCRNVQEAIRGVRVLRNRTAGPHQQVQLLVQTVKCKKFRIIHFLGSHTADGCLPQPRGAATGRSTTPRTTAAGTRSACGQAPNSESLTANELSSSEHGSL